GLPGTISGEVTIKGLEDVVPVLGDQLGRRGGEEPTVVLEATATSCSPKLSRCASRGPVQVRVLLCPPRARRAARAPIALRHRDLHRPPSFELRIGRDA